MINEENLPEGWRLVQVSDIATVSSGQGAPQGDEWYTGNNIFVKAGDLNNLTDQKYVGDNSNRISNKAIDHYNLKLYPLNAVVFPKSGMSVKTDNIALLKYDSYVVNHLAILEITKKDVCIPEYLYYFLKRVKISNISLNDAYPSIRLTDIQRFKLILPPFSIQEKLVKILGEAEKMKKWRAEADELANEFLKSVFLEMFGDPFKNPNNWQKLKFKEIIKGTPQNGLYKHSSFYSDTEGMPILRIDSFYDGKIENMEKLKRVKCTDEEKERFGLQKDDIVINRVNSLEYLGKCALVENILEPTVYESNMMRIRIDETINPVYLVKLLCTNFIYNQIVNRAKKAVNQASINQKDVNSFDILVPPIELQNQFAEIVKQVETLKTHQKQSKQQIDNLFNTLMQKAFKGELVC